MVNSDRVPHILADLGMTAIVSTSISAKIPIQSLKGKKTGASRAGYLKFSNRKQEG